MLGYGLQQLIQMQTDQTQRFPLKIMVLPILLLLLLLVIARLVKLMRIAMMLVIMWKYILILKYHSVVLSIVMMQESLRLR